MIWLILALVGAGSFFVTGFSLLTDPLCISADFGGGRVVQVTCRSDEFGTVTGTQAGLISILIGLGILTLIFWRPIKAMYIDKKLLKEANNQTSIDFSITEENTSAAKINVNSDSLDIKKCPKCAEDIKAEAIACKHCGRDIVKKLPPPNNPPVSQPAPVQNTSMGLSLAALILGIISAMIGIYDIALVSDGTYDYILESEIGLLAILSFTSLGLAIAAKVKQQRISAGALTAAIIAVVVFLACTTYSIPSY
jgi:hypothetical protein